MMVRKLYIHIQTATIRSFQLGVLDVHATCPGPMLLAVAR